MMLPYLNPRRRRRHARRAFGGRRGGLLSQQVLVPAVGGGVLAGLAQSYLVPWVTGTFGLAPTGVLYRAVQGGVAVGGAWALDQTRMLPPAWTRAMAGYGLAFAALGLISDLQRGGIGALVPTSSASSGSLEGLGMYERAVPAAAPRALTAGASSFGTSRSALGTYYAALARR